MDSVARWLDRADAPDAFCGFHSFAYGSKRSLSINAPRVIAKDGFGSEIRMSFDRTTGVMCIDEVVDVTGQAFPSRYDTAAFTTRLCSDHSAALAYAELTENSGVRVRYIGQRKSVQRLSGG